MSASLVGSEMCIRDRLGPELMFTSHERDQLRVPTHELCEAMSGSIIPVSYTHLTLPTICSV
eukprot:11977404-Alexandrium_andersonii.AAC.1